MTQDELKQLGAQASLSRTCPSVPTGRSICHGALCVTTLALNARPMVAERAA